MLRAWLLPAEQFGLASPKELRLRRRPPTKKLRDARTLRGAAEQAGRFGRLLPHRRAASAETLRRRVLGCDAGSGSARRRSTKEVAGHRIYGRPTCECK